jgi:hypothetical protein
MVRGIAALLLCGMFCRAAPCAEPTPPRWSIPPDHAQDVTIAALVPPHTYRLVTFHDPGLGLAYLSTVLEETHAEGRLVSCSVLISIALTRYEAGFAGVCVLRKHAGDERVQVCRDTGVGKFMVAPMAATDATKATLTRFLENNCLGG